MTCVREDGAVNQVFSESLLCAPRTAGSRSSTSEDFVTLSSVQSRCRLLPQQALTGITVKQALC